jgi:hypothetical protein
MTYPLRVWAPGTTWVDAVVDGARLPILHDPSGWWVLDRAVRPRVAAGWLVMDRAEVAADSDAIPRSSP